MLLFLRVFGDGRRGSVDISRARIVSDKVGVLFETEVRSVVDKIEGTESGCVRG